MADIRVSFRLAPDSESAETWSLLKDRHRGRTEKFIFDELLRRERIRLENRRTHGDMLADILAIVSEIRAQLARREDDIHVP